MSIKILVADNSLITRAGIRSLLSSEEKLEIIGEADNGLDAIRKAEELSPDIVLIDVSMPKLSGIEATRQILKKNQDVKVIALSNQRGKQFVKGMLNAGARGYLIKDEAAEDLPSAIRKVEEGDIFLSSRVTQQALSFEESSQTLSNARILRTKLRRPPVTDDYIIRKDIVNELEKFVTKPLSLVSAGAGYGKSSVVSQWLEYTEYLHGWISLDEEHNDLQIFLQYLFEAVNSAIPNSLKETANAISAPILPPFHQLSRVLFNDLCEINQELVLVLDDFYKINNEKVHQLINNWLEFPPPHIHLVIVTRRDPPLDLQSLRLKGRVAEIRMEELSFSKEESVELFKKLTHVELTEQDSERLLETTEGWIIALRLVSLLVKSPQDVEKILAMDQQPGGIKAISEYLMSEVLPGFPQNIRHRLLSTSVLNRFCGALIDEATGQSQKEDEEGIDGEQFIQWLRQENMFVIPLDFQGEWYRFHHLFQDLLQMQLMQIASKEEIKEIHIRASRWYEEQELLDEAMHHAMAAGSNERAVGIIKRHRLPLINQGNWSYLDRLFERIPKEYVDQDAELLLVEAYLRFCYADHLGVGKSVEKMLPIMGRKGIPVPIHGEYEFYQGYATIYLKKDPKGSLEHMERSLLEIPESSTEPRALMELFYVLFSQIAGRYEQAKLWLEELIEKSADFAPTRKTRLKLSMLLTSMSQADLEQVRKYSERAIKAARESSLKDSLGICLLVAGQLHLRQGRWEQTIPFFEEVLQIKYHVHTRSVEDSFVGLVLANHFLGNTERCLDLIDEFEQYAGDLGDNHSKFIWSLKARYAMLRDSKEDLQDLIRLYQQDFLHLVFWLDVPEITYARALIYEGSQKNMQMAREQLNSLMKSAEAQYNRIHLFELYAIESLYFLKQEELTSAKKSLQKSLEIAEPEQMTAFYVEMYEWLRPLFEIFSKVSNTNSFLANIETQAKEIESKRQTTLTNSALEKDVLNPLTQRELEVLGFVAEGYRNQEIAEKLFKSEDTIKKHLYHMFQKLQVKNRMSLVTRAKEEGILE